MKVSCLLSCIILAGCLGSQQDQETGKSANQQIAGAWVHRGAWLAPRSGYPLDSEEGSRVLNRMRKIGIRQVAVGHDVQMPKVKEPKLVWGEGDEKLVAFLRRAKAAGLGRFLIPRIESPDFFKPPYPFRGDIQFATQKEWDRFHDDMQAMVVHYAKLAQREGVELLGLSLEMKHSVRKFPDRWRQIIRAARKVFKGAITYSANWYQEWQHVEFWDELDFIGIGAYFELKPDTEPEPTSKPVRPTVAELVRRWQPIVKQLRQASKRFGKPVLFTEVGYTGYVDTAEKPWEWAGKQEKGVKIDFEAQRRAWQALLQVVRQERCLAGLYAWSYYNNPKDIARWEYGIQERPAEEVLTKAYRRGR